MRETSGDDFEMQSGEIKEADYEDDSGKVDDEEEHVDESASEGRNVE